MALAVVLVVLFPLGLNSQRTGSIAGSVLLDNRVGLQDSRVVYNKVIRMGRDSRGSIVELEPHLSGSVRTNAEGSFRIDSLSAGEYYLCALLVQANQIKSCDSPNPPVTVREATAVAGVVLIVRTGVLLSIVIDDTTSRINSQTLAVGWVSPSGAYSPATQSARTAQSATFTVAIPKDSSGNLFLDGSLTILDTASVALRMRARSVPVSVNQESDKTVSLRVQ
jgi:hypothetical protein